MLTACDNITIGVVAEVDSGKTTLCEAIFSLCGVRKEAGSVDRGTSFFDFDEYERRRGITVYSKQAIFPLRIEQLCNEKQEVPVTMFNKREILVSQLDTHEITVTLLDTPGHADFVAETQRALPVLDYAIFLFGASKPLQEHTRTLWNLLRSYQIPTFVFVNKMDQCVEAPERILAKLSETLDATFARFDRPFDEAFYETLALCDEQQMEDYLAGKRPDTEQLRGLIQSCHLYPCYFGAALKMRGVDELLRGIGKYLQPPAYGADFAARVFKLTTDTNGSRLTHLKITGGVLRVKDAPGNPTEKINQIRLYHGEKYSTVSEIRAGSLCAVTGLSTLRAGSVLGAASQKDFPAPIQPMQMYRLLPQPPLSAKEAYLNLQPLLLDYPHLEFSYQSETDELVGCFMGELEKEWFLDYTQHLRSSTKGTLSLFFDAFLYNPDDTADEETSNLLDPAFEEVDLISNNFEQSTTLEPEPSASKRRAKRAMKPTALEEEDELNAIFERTYGPIRSRASYTGQRTITAHQDTTQDEPSNHVASSTPIQQYLLIDGYNIIFAWKEFEELAQVTLDGARDRLIELLTNYQAYTGITVILVFDAYKVAGNLGHISMIGTIHVVYTKEAETADAYIEKTVRQIDKKHRVRVATSDALEQLIIWGAGATRLSARGLYEELMDVESQIRTHFPGETQIPRNYPFSQFQKDT